MKLKCEDGVVRDFDTNREYENKNVDRPEDGAEIRWWFQCKACKDMPGLDSTNSWKYAKKRARQHACPKEKQPWQRRQQ